MKRKESIMPNDDWYMYTVHSPAKPSDPGSPLSPLIPRKPRGPLAPLRPITPIVPFEPVSPFSNIAELAVNNIVSYMYMNKCIWQVFASITISFLLVIL